MAVVIWIVSCDSHATSLLLSGCTVHMTPCRDNTVLLHHWCSQHLYHVLFTDSGVWLDHQHTIELEGCVLELVLFCSSSGDVAQRCWLAAAVCDMVGQAAVVCGGILLQH
jgi:hypothetical protein